MDNPFITLTDQWAMIRLQEGKAVSSAELAEHRRLVIKTVGSYEEETITIRKDYFDNILLQLDSLREEVERLSPSIKDYKIDAVAWNAERETSAPRKHWIDTVDYRKRDPWGSI